MKSFSQYHLNVNTGISDNDDTYHAKNILGLGNSQAAELLYSVAKGVCPTAKHIFPKDSVLNSFVVVDSVVNEILPTYNGVIFRGAERSIDFDRSEFIALSTNGKSVMISLKNDINFSVKLKSSPICSVLSNGTTYGCSIIHLSINFEQLARLCSPATYIRLIENLRLVSVVGAAPRKDCYTRLGKFGNRQIQLTRTYNYERGMGHIHTGFLDFQSLFNKLLLKLR